MELSLPIGSHEIGLGLEDGRVLLRAERMATGEGRVYTLTYRATDAFGYFSTTTGTVPVPHNL